ncbi:MAG: peroxiredoxin [Pseudohongiellaceae bacterium]|jgi:peroxiredoxin
MNVLKPRQAAPELSIETLKGNWKLTDQRPDSFTMIVFYRGLHCPLCLKYLTELESVLSDFADVGVGVIALSSDDQDRAQQTAARSTLEDLTLGYGLTAETAQVWGLHRSAGKGETSTGVEEPDEFNEPGLFLVRPDNTLYWSNVSTMPFARPNFTEILGAVKFVVANNYPARGELA